MNRRWALLLASCPLIGAFHLSQPHSRYNLLRVDAQPTTELQNTQEYNKALRGCVANGDARSAEQLVKQMVDTCEERPDLTTYYTLLDAHAKSNDSDSGSRAAEILETLQNNVDLGAPDARAYRSVMQALLKDQKSHRALELYQMALENNVQITAPLQACLLEAHSQKLDAQAAQDVLDQMEATGWASDIAYCVVLKAWKELATQRPAQQPHAAHQALLLLNRMVDRKLATAIAYSTAMGVVSLAGTVHAAEQVQNLLHQMQESETIIVNTLTYNVVLQAWVQANCLEKAEAILVEMENSVEPDIFSFTTLLNGYANSDSPDRMERVEALWERLQRRYQQGHDNCRPNRVTYTALARNYGRTAPEKAEQAVRDMYASYQANPSPDLRHNTQLVTLVLDAWAKSGRSEAGPRAQALLLWMLQVYQNEPHSVWRPNAYSFNAAMTAWSRSRTFGKALQTYGLLQKMKTLHQEGVLASGPNIYCYSAVLSACKSCENDADAQKEAIKVAIAVYKEILENTDVEPNQVVYAKVLEVLRRLPAGPQRSSAVLSVINKAAESGFVDASVCRVMGTLLSADEIQGLVGQRQLSTNSIPSSWSRMVAIV